MKSLGRWLALAAVAAVGCSSHPSPGGGDDDGDDVVTPRPDATPPGPPDALVPDAIPPDAGPPPSPWTELSAPGVDTSGGNAPLDGQGAAGATDALTSAGAITIDPSLPAAVAPTIPVAPSGGEVITDLGADVTRDGAIRISASLASSDAVRTITSTGGDIIVDGAIDAGSGALQLRAPSGTVYLSGTITSQSSIDVSAANVVITGALDASGAWGGNAGGTVRLAATAGPVIVTGPIVTAGSEHADGGGAGGSIDVSASGAVWLGGAIDSFGGDAIGDVAANAGAGGALHVSAGGDLTIAGIVRTRGGAAQTSAAGATGGAAGAITLEAPGVIRLDAIVDARGGLVASGAAPITAGAGGALTIGDQVRPSAIELRGLTSAGGTGGGTGGDVALVARGGDLTIAGLRVDGGASNQVGGSAGNIDGTTGPTAGAILVSGRIDGNGGAGTSGGIGSRLRLLSTSTSGNFTVTATGVLALDGGAATTGPAGGGGDLTLETMDGDASMAGQILARGGTATAGGNGGEGGILELFTDRNYNGVGGDLRIESTGLIDVSGGDGALGGSARNNGGPGVALFPIHQDQLSVLLNSDGIHGNPVDGTIQNDGTIIAHGGAANGWGGDVEFHGRRPGTSLDPLPGNVSMDGNGTGESGSYVAE